MASITTRVWETLDHKIYRTGRDTVVFVTSPNRQGLPDVQGLGVAKRHPNDKDNRRIGYQIALARALRDYADKLEGHAL